MWQLVISNGVNLVGKLVENKFITDVAINQANNELVKDVVEKVIAGAVVLGVAHEISEGIKYVIDKANKLDVDFNSKNGTNASVKMSK